MAAIIFFNYCITTPSKRFCMLQNKFFRHFISFLFNSNLKRTNIWMGSCISLFSKTPHIALPRWGLRSGCKFCLIAVRTVFSWIFNSLGCFLIDLMGYFLIAVAKVVKKLSFRFLFNPPLPLSLKKLFFCEKKFFFALYIVNKKIWLRLGVKQIIYYLLFLF